MFRFGSHHNGCANIPKIKKKKSQPETLLVSNTLKRDIQPAFLLLQIIYKGGEMTQTMYAHMNKGIKKKPNNP
jgi:hypothetical protein